MLHLIIFYILETKTEAHSTKYLIKPSTTPTATTVLPQPPETILRKSTRILMNGKI